MTRTIQISPELHLRLFEASDVDELHALITRNLEWLKPWMNWAHDRLQRFEVADFLQSAVREARERTAFTFAIVLDARIAGAISVHDHDPLNRIARIGYWLDERQTGKGIVTKATGRMIDFAFDVLNAHRIEIRCAPENTKSRAIPRRLGFSEEGTQKEVLWVRDHFSDLVIYALLESSARKKNG